MTQLINEVKRMQFLAGLINESQLNEAEFQSHSVAARIKEILKGLGYEVKDFKGSVDQASGVLFNDMTKNNKEPYASIGTIEWADGEEVKALVGIKPGMDTGEVMKKKKELETKIYDLYNKDYKASMSTLENGNVIVLGVKAKPAAQPQQESQLNEAEIDFTNKEQFADFLQNKTKELEGKTIKLSVFDTFAMGDPEKEKFTGDISVNLGKRTGGTGNLKYDATLVDAGGYKYLSPSKGKKISLTIPSTTGGQGGFENEELKLKGLFKVKSLEMPGTQAESINIDSVVNEALRKLRKGK